MIGSIRWNWLLSLVFGILTLLISLSRNPLDTSLKRGFYTFVCVFAIGFIFRYLMGLAVRAGERGALPSDSHPPVDTGAAGRNVDLSTPDEAEELRKMMNESLAQAAEPDQFSPLQPPKLATKDKLDPELMAHAVRHLTDDEGR